MVSNVLRKTWAPLKDWVMMYKSVVQAVLLYSRKRWVVTYEMMTVLEVFHNNIERRITGMTARRDSGW